MKKKVFCVILLWILCGCPVVSRAGLSNTDLNLMSGTPDLIQADKDPYWDLAWHTRAAAAGDADSLFFLAHVYEAGRLVPKNPVKARSYYEQAAVKGLPEACMVLAERATTPAEKEQWYLKAAQDGYTPAQLALFHLYETAGDTTRAIVWLERALRQMFPHTADLTTVSPDLQRLKGAL